MKKVLLIHLLYSKQNSSCIIENSFQEPDLKVILRILQCVSIIADLHSYIVKIYKSIVVLIDSVN